MSKELLRLTISESDKTPLDIWVNVEIENRLVAANISPKLLARNAKVKTSYTSAPSTMSNDIGISDEKYLAETGTERFILVTVATSLVTANAVRVYYDKLYYKLMMLPELDSIDPTIANVTYELYGYATKDDILLPTPKENISSECAQYNLGSDFSYGIESFYNVGISGLNGNFYEYGNNKTASSTIVDIPDLFVASDAKTNIPLLIQTSPSLYQLHDAGNVATGRVQLLLDF